MNQYQLFPELNTIEFERLKTDIAENGVLVPVEIDENGNTLDGHHRIKIWNELKSEGIKLEDYPRLVRGGMTEDEKINHVRRLNLLRRHLKPEQMKPHWKEMRKNGMTNQAIADTSGVSEATVRRTVSTNDETQFVTGKDGKQYPAKKTTVFVKNKRQEQKTTENLQLVNPGGTLEHRQLDRKASTYKREHEIAQLREDLPDKTERYELYQKSCEEIAETLGPESVDCIITDPPYPYEFIKTFSELSKTASIVLKPGGYCLVMSGQSHLPDVMKRLSENLQYHWCGAYMTTGSHTNIHQRKTSTGWKPILWYQKGKYEGKYIGYDVFKSTGNDKDHHFWGQNVAGFDEMVKSYCNPGKIIFDPFVGGGTTGVAALENGCYFIGSDIDKNSIKKTANRLNDL